MQVGKWTGSIGPCARLYVGPEASADGRREDLPLSLRQHLALLEQAGFSTADVVWKRFNFAVYVGVKVGLAVQSRK